MIFSRNWNVCPGQVRGASSSRGPARSATDRQLQKIRREAYGNRLGPQYAALPFVMDDGRGEDFRIETDLYMLPPRPLAQMRSRDVRTGKRQQLYLLTLLDERWRWYEKS